MTVQHPLARRAFSLIEMLTVILILSIVLSIIIPAIAKARTSARRSATQVILKTVSDGAFAFEQDQKRAPGYYSAFEMGGNENATTRGVTGMDNVMLDLLGAVTKISGGSGAPSENISDPDIGAAPRYVRVGPYADNNKNVWVDRTAMGAARQPGSKGAYITLDPKSFAVQAGAGRGGLRMGGTADPHANLPALIDTFGTPILAWQQDTAPAAADTFARDIATTANRARFYAASNYGFTNSQRLGKLGEDMRFVVSGSTVTGSLINPQVTAPKLALTLASLLGAPGSPIVPSPASGDAPASARAGLVLHSAGENGSYLEANERGGKVARANAGAAQYTVKYENNKDSVTGGAFDDMIQAAGN